MIWNGKIFASILIRFRKFQQESKLVNELKTISKSLQGDTKDTQAAFHKGISTVIIILCENILFVRQVP